MPGLLDLLLNDPSIANALSGFLPGAPGAGAANPKAGPAAYGGLDTLAFGAGQAPQDASQSAPANSGFPSIPQTAAPALGILNSPETAGGLTTGRSAAATNPAPDAPPAAAFGALSGPQAPSTTASSSSVATPVPDSSALGRIGSAVSGLGSGIGNFATNNGLTLMALGAGMAGAPNLATGISRGLAAAVPAAAAEQKQRSQLQSLNETYKALIAAGASPNEAFAATTNPELLKTVAAKYLTPKLVTSTDKDGSVWQTNPVTGEKKLLPDNSVDTTTADQKNYEYAKENDFTGSFTDYEASVKRAGATNVLTNVDTKGEGAEAQEAGKLAATRRGDMLSAADAAPEKIARLSLLRNVLANTQTGPLAGVEGTAGAVANSLGISPDTLKGLGIDPNQATNNQIAQKLANELVVGSIGAKNGGFPASNFSVAERQFIEQMFPSIASQPGSNQAVSDVLIAREQRNLQKADEWAQYKAAQRQAKQPISYEDFEDQWGQKHNQDNVFAPIQQKFLSGAYGPIGAPVPTPNPTAMKAMPQAPAAQQPQVAPSPVPKIKLPSGIQVPQAAVQYLRANPNTRSDFEQHYGAGSATPFLGGR